MDVSDQTVEGPVVPHDPRFREVLVVLLRNKWFILLASLGTILLSVVYTLQSPSTFEGTTTVLINSKAGQQANPFTQDVDLTSNKLLNEISILKSRGLASRVATSLLASPFLDSTRSTVMPILKRSSDESPQRNISDVNTVTDRLQRSVSFLTEKESDVIRIVAIGVDPREAARIANTYAEMYLEQVLQMSRSRSRSVREFLEGRLADQRAQLQQAEAAMKQFMESSGIVSLDGESNQLVQELSQLEATRNGLSIEIEGLNKKMNSLQAELPRQESSVANAMGQANDPYIRLLGEQVSQLEVTRDVMLAQNDPEVLNQPANQARLKEIGDQINMLRENLRKRTGEMIWGGATGTGSAGTQADGLDYIRGLRQQLLETKIQLEMLRSRRSALSSIISEYEDRFRRIPRQSMDLARTQRERLSTEKLYGLVEEKYNEAAIAEKSEFGYVDIIDRATPEGSKSRSTLLQNTILGLLIGFGLATAIAFVRDAIDVRVRTPEQLHRQGFVTLSEIAMIDRELKTLEFNGSLPQEARDLSPKVTLVYNPLSFTAECYRRLRTSLMRLRSQQSIRTLLVTSPNPEEGKSTTLVSLAISLAETDQRVLVIDCDLRRPAIHTLLGLPRSPGFTDVVAGEKSNATTAHRNVVPNLDVLTCGTPAHHPSRFFGHTKSIEAVMAIRDQYDWILVDAPPVLVVNDASVLASIVDGAIMIIDTGITRLDALKRASTILQDAGGKVMGIVLNRFDPKTAYGLYYGSPRYGHYDNRHSYYHSIGNNHGAK